MPRNNEVKSDTWKLAQGLTLLSKYDDVVTWGRHEVIGVSGVAFDDMPWFEVLLLKLGNWYWDEDLENGSEQSWIFITD